MGGLAYLFFRVENGLYIETRHRKDNSHEPHSRRCTGRPRLRRGACCYWTEL
nr:MAG TPA: hypothetical protein [Caudoviricetes sp.]